MDQHEILSKTNRILRLPQENSNATVKEGKRSFSFPREAFRSERLTRRGQGSRSVSLIVTKPTEPSVKKIMMKTNGYFVLNGEVEADEAVLPHIERDYARAQDKFRTLLGRHVGLHGPLQTQLVEQGSTEMAPVKVHTLLEGYIRGREIAKGTKTLFLQGPYYLSDYEQEGTEGLAERSE
ncbi:hypothetical protein L486_05696 [Kwoniella mangroviensis CBS 10435]|uniref:Uncharacterized protein n=1 Tax=Kwoniella mangroviensis CBS 10435 TaxID=1331196 RepID=A0A1B9IN29_9TREE|nr:hypothetical protein L486_05696 [Kwoniella mangroviensis CBS 10435]